MQTIEKNGYLYITGKIGSFLSFFLAGLKRRTLLFYETEDEALLLKEELEYFSKGAVHLFPPYAQRVFEQEDEVKRTGFLYHLLTDDTFMGLFPCAAIAQPLISMHDIVDQMKEVRFGDVIYQEEITAYLDKTGYELTPLVREEGGFAKRGSIIDVYPPSYERPVRIEFLGDEVLSIRSFDPITQRSLGEIERACLIPVKSQADRDNRVFDYVGPGTVLVHNGIDSLVGAMEADEERATLARHLREGIGVNLHVDISGIRGDEDGPVMGAASNNDLRQLFELKKTEIFSTLSEKLRLDWSQHRYVYVFASSLHQAERLKEIFRNYGISLPLLNNISFATKEKEWGIVVGPLRRGFRTGDIILLTEEDIVGPKKRAAKKKTNGVDDFLSSFKDLKVGEWVVHVDHGIGIYKGITVLQIGGYTKDFLLIEYQDGDKLYVPVEDLQLVQKFIGSEKFKPKIDRLGSQLWINAKKRVKKHVEDIAQELIGIHAERELAEGHSYPADDEIFREMESRFLYEETEGQLRAIEDVLGDLRVSRPMDRLVCGDVGFGKTEVALRASFKAVLDGKQVAMLVPTTVLAQQHCKTFNERFQDYPITIETLSRFRSKEAQKKVLEGLKKGTVDVVIGTHRLLQKDLSLKDLGLLVIDEEHRFGVKHKEKLKVFKKNVDVLTLSATPIPRTLYMAMMGIKDLSTIDTPPLDRFAVKTFVVRFSDDLIRKAISDELSRGGQVFFVHNYIHNIGVVYDHLRMLVPDARIAVAHGKTEGKALEKIMLDFIDGKYDVLLSTNIIESGLDIANVNTIFINNAHRMGLADLYQLRGRVGRSTKQAFAYLLVPKAETLTKDATTRLKIIEEMTELGSGIHIANHDLEIRGAGNLLGKEQSGNINVVGFELYCSMLEDAIKRLRENWQPEREEIAVEINLPVDAFIPDDYINEPAQKLLTYKRLSKVQDEAELRDMEAELRDRYGDMSRPLKNLIEIISLKIVLSRAKVKKLEYAGKQIVVHVTRGTPINPERVLRLAKDEKRRVKLLPDGKVIVHTEKVSEELIGAARNVLMEIVGI